MHPVREYIRVKYVADILAPKSPYERKYAAALKEYKRVELVVNPFWNWSIFRSDASICAKNWYSS